ncbi:MAG TPA: UbiH/UbiF/VisC/COQ6 family ubiquinone biosynthesis hydroxylase [Halomonas sp.]|nr:UbiH/UbiF/VisC/COQ6 family ubiquinone biosynthesis hydroxylase [Halomonas sp.]
MNQHFDAIIVGGGMVGSALAAALGQGGFSVALVESGSEPGAIEDDAFDLRVSSLNLAAQRLLESVGAWSHIPAERRCIFRHIHAWDISGHGETHFDAAALGLDDFGSFVENRVIRRALWRCLASLPGVEPICQTRPLAMITGSDRVLVELDNGRLIGGSLVVGADGARSTIRELAGIKVDALDYGQRALIVNVVTQLPQQDVSWQRFTPEGPQAMLPLPGPHASLVWYGEPEATRAREALSDEALRQTIEREFPARLGGLKAVTGRASFPIRRQHARHYTASRLALVGDAAHVIHPLAGQGLNLGLQDVTALADLLATAHTTKHGDLGDLGATGPLRRYAWQRRPQTLAMIAATEAFHRVFTGSPMLRSAGAAGLAVAERLGPAKNLMMRRALGI